MVGLLCGFVSSLQPVFPLFFKHTTEKHVEVGAWFFKHTVVFSCPGSWPTLLLLLLLQVQDRVWERCRWCSWWHEVLRKIAAAKKPRQGCSALASECVFVWGGALDLLPLQEWWRRRWRAPRGCQSDVLLWWSCCCCTPLLSAPQSRTGE